MAVALRRDDDSAVAEIIEALEQANGRPDDALRRAVACAAEIAPYVLDMVEKAANGVFLLPRQQNLLFWGIHILGAARCHELYRPLLTLVRIDREAELDRLLGDVVTITLQKILLSVFDGDPAPLFEASADRNADGFVRWSLMGALARLTFDGAIPREHTVEFLSRIAREPLAEPGDAAWTGWQEAVLLLRDEELRKEVHATWKDGRNPETDVEREGWDEEFAKTVTLAADDVSPFLREHLTPLDDPLAALSWIESEAKLAARKAPAKPSRFGADPAASIALASDEIDWLAGFLESRLAPLTAMSMEQIDGFFCALIAGPHTPEPSEYMPVIWDTGDDPDMEIGPDFDSLEQSEYVTNLIARHWDSIALRLDRGYPHDVVVDKPYNEPAGRYWAGGFIRGVAMRAKDWGARTHIEDVKMFLGAVVKLGTDESQDLIEALGPDLRKAIVARLPLLVANTHHLVRGREQPFPPDPPPPPDFGRKVGRNEPCPCGSGKKYKFCCGSPTRQSLN